MLLYRKSVLAAEIETTPGTAETLAAANAALNIFNAKMTADIEQEDRAGQSSFARLPSIPGAGGGTCTFSTELTGGASAPSWATTFLPACGYVATGLVYTPKTEAPGTNVKTLTIGLYEDGRLKMLRGAMGNAVFRMDAGKRIMIDFTFRGIWVAPTDVAILAPTYPTVAPLKFTSSALAVGAWTPVVAALTLDMGNTVILREDSADPSGYKSAAITDMNVNGTIDPEAALIAGKDVYGEWASRAEAALAIVLGTTGNKVTFGAPKCQTKKIEDADRNGLRIDQIAFQCNRSASAGDDQLSITFA